MKWETYKKHFTKEAILLSITEEDINNCLLYAERLFKQNLPVIYDHEHFSKLVGFDSSYIYSAANSPMHFYKTFSILKKNGKQREISEPLPNLKEIQKWILINILENKPISRFSKSFIKNHSIKDNAKFHKNQPVVLSLDIKDFFPSIKVNKVYSLFLKFGYSKRVAGLLSNLCTLNKSLPQGAPTSPYISNLVFVKNDNRIFNFVKKYNIRYTRYADDLTFSGDFLPGMIIKFVRRILEEDGYKLNNDKIRVMKQNKCQQVTGVVVNKKIQAPLKLRKEIRQEVYYIKKYGLEDYLKWTNNYKKHYIEHLLGKINFCLFLNPHDKSLKLYKSFIYQLIE